jgi:hypothetical protein
MSILLGAFGGARIPDPMSITGSLSATGSTVAIAGTTRTWTVPASNSGVIRFQSVSTDGAGAVQYSKNGGAFTTVVSNDEVTFVNGDTIQMRTTGLSVGQSGIATLYDVSGLATFGPYTWERTS